MQHDTKVNSLDDKLQELITGNTTTSSQEGVHLTLVLLALILVLFGAMTHFIHTETYKLETQVQETVTQTLSRQIERRLLSFSSQLQDLALNDYDHPICSEFDSLFRNYEEFVEFTILASDKTVAGTCLTHSALDTDPYLIGETIQRETTKKTIDHATNLRTMAFSSVYQKKAGGPAFVDLVIPSIDGSAYIARINLLTLIRALSDESIDYQYKMQLFMDGKEFTQNAMPPSDAKTDNIVTTAALPPLPSNLSIVVTNTSPRSIYTHTTLVYFILVFATLLVIAILSILRYQYRQASIESSLRARVIVQQALSQSYIDGLCVTDRRGKILFTNEAFARIFGFAHESLLDKTPPFAFCADKTVFDFDRMTQEKTTHIRRDFTATRADGSTFDCQTEIVPLPPINISEVADNQDDDMSEVIGKRFLRRPGWLLSFRDVTEQNRAHNLMLLTHERTLRVLDTMDAAVSVVSTQGASPELLFANRRYTESLGDGVAAHLRLKALAAQADPVGSSTEVFDEVTQMWLAVSIKQISWVDGSQVETLSARNVTKRKKNEELLEQQLKNAEQASHLITMGEMASSLAHELNQPLAAVQNYASAGLTMLESKRLTEENMKTGFNKIINQTQRAAQIIKRIRSFAKRNEPLMAPVSVERIIEEVMELATLQSRKLGIPIVLEVNVHDAQLTCDAVMIEQVLLNLLKNALEATPPNADKPVRFRIVSEDTYIVFYVSDNGCGISEQTARHIFDPFFTTKATGMGIGLNICRSIVENHHGRLSFENNQGGGTTFRLSLPASVR